LQIQREPFKRKRLNLLRNQRQEVLLQVVAQASNLKPMLHRAMDPATSQVMDQAMVQALNHLVKLQAVKQVHRVLKVISNQQMSRHQLPRYLFQVAVAHEKVRMMMTARVLSHVALALRLSE